MPAVNGGFLQNLISSLIDRRTSFDGVNDKRSMDQLCDALLARNADSSPRKLGAAILTKYAKLNRAEKLAFFEYINDALDLDAQAVEHAAQLYKTEASPDNLARLLEAAEPKRQELLRRLNQLPEATAALVSMREDLLSFIPEVPALKRADQDFAHLFTSWFNRGFLVVKHISWETSASVLAKIIQYEAVHAINDWDDLRRRLQPVDRRCFAFFHPAMPAEPLVFVEVALTNGAPKSIQDILDEKREATDPQQADTAAFYSISNCQKGLRGISFGNLLIKQVAVDLSRDFPNIKNFVTISPIPGFAAWLEKAPLGDENKKALTALKDKTLTKVVPADVETVAERAKALAAHYLRDVKRADGYPDDAVARFHLNNGAKLYDLHALADISPKGLSQSLGVMVNYHYDLNTFEANQEAYVSDKTVQSTRAVDQLASQKLN